MEKNKNEYLNFKRAPVEADLIRYYPFIKNDRQKLELLILRSNLLSKNKLFVKDWLKLEKDWKKLDKTKPDYSKRLNKINKAFIDKWNVDPFTGLYYFRHEPNPIPVEEIDDNDYLINSDYLLGLKVDLRYSKQEIMKRFESVIDEHLKVYNEQEQFKKEYKDVTDELIKAGFIKNHAEPAHPLKGNIPADLSDYEKYIEVWKLREIEKKSWKEISQELKLNSLQTARNHFNAACHLIKHGIPGFGSFPQK